MKLYARKQYELVCESRGVLFDYCKTISNEDFLNQHSSFGRGGSMRNLLVHIATTYQFWIANTALKKNLAYAVYNDYQNMEAVMSLFNEVDAFMDAFIAEHMGHDEEIVYKVNDGKETASPLKLFTHVITHEYHHKGQILSLSRHLGYLPVDTDVMR